MRERGKMVCVIGERGKMVYVMRERGKNGLCNGRGKKMVCVMGEVKKWFV